MLDLRDLYQELIIDHNRSPRNFYEMERATHHAQGNNPLCGDELTLYLHIDDGEIAKVSFTGVGCAISTASASLLTEALQGKTIAQAQALFKKFHHMLTQDNDDLSIDMGKLAVFSGVKDYPARVKCATLAWHTFQAALENSHDTISTE